MLALISALGYGIADFLAGLAARRAGNVVTVTLLVYAAGTVALLAAVAWHPGGRPDAASVAWGAASGCGCGAGALFLAAGFRRAPFSVAGPLSAVIGAGLSVLAGLALGNRPGPAAWLGLLLAFPAVMALSAAPGAPRLAGPAGPGEQRALWRSRRRGAWRAGGGGTGFGVLAGIGCAVSLTGLGQASPAAGLWPVLAAQAAALVTTAAVAAVRGDLRLPPGRAVRPSACSGLVGAAAAAAYLAAVHTGMLAIAAVVTSLFPAVTVALGVAVENERLSVTRRAGLALTLASAALVALPSAPCPATLPEHRGPCCPQRDEPGAHARGLAPRRSGAYRHGGGVPLNGAAFAEASSTAPFSPHIC